MTKNEVMDVIDSLAQSQGSYGRLATSLREAEANGEDTTSFFDVFECAKSALDVVMIIEG